MSDFEKEIEMLEGWEKAAVVSGNGEDFPVRWDNQVGNKTCKKFLVGKIVYAGQCCYVKPSALRGCKVSPRITSLCNFSDPAAPTAGYLDDIPLYTVKIIISSIRTDIAASREVKATVPLRVTKGELHYRNQVRIELQDHSTVIVTHGSDIAAKLIDELSKSGPKWYPHWPDRLIRHRALDEEETEEVIRRIKKIEITINKRH